MAWVWSMVANFDENATAARAFEAAFDRTPFNVPHAGEVKPMVGVELNSSGWEAVVCPYVKRPHGFGHLNGHGGPKDAMEAEDLDAAARVLYERLCPLLGYRFAFTGVEVADWKSPKELTEQLKPNGVLRSFNLDGLVLSADMWERAEKPDGFVPFGESFVWLPIPARL